MVVSRLEEVKYYFITDRGAEVSLKKQAEIAYSNGVDMVQYRGKGVSDRKMYEEASRLKNISEKYGGLFIVNDRVDIALSVDADGVHLGQDDLPAKEARELIGDKILGISTHRKEEALEAEKTADYIGIGPVHPTSTKDDTREALGVGGVLNIAREVGVPTVAIGGVTKDDLHALARGVDMVCSISEVTREGDLSSNVQEFEDEFKRAKEKTKDAEDDYNRDDPR